MADDSKMTSLADLIKSISEGKGFKGKSMDPGFIMEMPDPYEGMSEEEKEMRKKIDKIMTERFTIDPFEGMSEEEIKKIKERNKRWRELLERSRKRMGLPESIQLLNQGGIMDVNRMTKPLGYYRGGPAGAPELDEGYDPILGDWMKDRKMRKAQPPAGAVDMTGQYVTPPEKPRWGKAKDLGKKALEGIRSLFVKEAEGSELSPAEELKLLKLQLMLEKGMPGSTLMPSGDPDKIKRLENRIIELYTQLGE